MEAGGVDPTDRTESYHFSTAADQHRSKFFEESKMEAEEEGGNGGGGGVSPIISTRRLKKNKSVTIKIND